MGSWAYFCGNILTQWPLANYTKAKHSTPACAEAALVGRQKTKQGVEGFGKFVFCLVCVQSVFCVFFNRKI